MFNAQCVFCGGIVLRGLQIRGQIAQDCKSCAVWKKGVVLRGLQIRGQVAQDCKSCAVETSASNTGNGFYECLIPIK